MNIDRDLLRSYNEDEADKPAGAPPLPDNWRPIAHPASRPMFDAAPQPQRHAPMPPVTPLNPEQPMRRQTSAPVPTAPAVKHGDTNISINITMPKFKKPTLPKWDYRKIGIRVGIVIGLIVASLIIHAVIVAVINHRKEEAAKHRIDMIEQRQTPTFTPAVPKNDKQVAKTAAYDPKRDSYSYSDTIKGLQVVVSQQRLPDGSTDATIAKIAKSMQATTPLITGKGTAYIASNSGGAQLVVLGTKSLLIFVQSPFTHSTADWTSYLDTLQA